MGLESIHIKNYKCIRDYKISLKKMNLLLGENGSGKTNILSAIMYFYDNMISQKPAYDIFDENNRLNDKVEITLTYDLSKLLIRSRKNRKENKERHLKYYKAIEGLSDNGKISLTLSQVKGGKISWNYEIEKRKIIYHLYPLYKVDAREINLTDWEEIWKNIGDLIKPDSKESEILHQNVKKTIEDGSIQLKGRLEQLNGILERLQINSLKFSISEASANMAKMYYDGREFSYTGQRLDSFSNGTNSYNYISLLLYILSIMGQKKMKEPVLLMDEPEISLHFHMIDELSDVLFECADDMSILAATHSPRLVKNILVKEQNNCTIYQVYKHGDYSQLCLLHMFAKEEKREKYFLTEHHANAFFAKMLILVEGETELELLQNPYLRILFPVLKQAEIIKGMSDKVIYRIIDTTTRHYNVPMAALLDMDQILEWKKAENWMEMEWKKEYQFVAEKEKYYYGAKRNETVPKRKRIQAMCDKCKFSYRYPFFGSEDENYKELIQVIQEYYRNYQIFPVSTTIEGTLINQKNYPQIVNYLIYTGKWNPLEKAYQMLYNETDRVNFLRLIFHGKSDFLMKIGSIIDNNEKIYPELKEALQGHAIAKTDWVSEWLSYYFAEKTNISPEKMTQRYLEKWCEEIPQRSKMVKQFSKDFSELYQFIDSINQLYQCEKRNTGY